MDLDLDPFESVDLDLDPNGTWIRFWIRIRLKRNLDPFLDPDPFQTEPVICLGSGIRIRFPTEVGSV